MAEGGFFARLFGFDSDESNSEVETRRENSTDINIAESTETTLQAAVNFVAELQSYYYNDICKMQSDLLVQTLDPSEERFINKKIKQDQTTLSQIDEILELVIKNEREYQSVWRKSVYSFYDEIEKSKLVSVQEKVFSIILKLCAINTKPELESIIRSRIEKYKEAWNISSEIQIPKSYNVILLEEKDGVEKYRFGSFYKSVYVDNSDFVLSSKRLDQIRNLCVEFESSIPTDQVWVYVSNVTRALLNLMKKTCILGNTWEYGLEQALYFDIIKVQDLENYIKGVLQIVLTRNTYAVISIVIPTRDMLSIIGTTKQEGDKIEICNKIRFFLKERSQSCKDNILTARIDRRNIPETLKFISYFKFKSIYF